MKTNSRRVEKMKKYFNIEDRTIWTEKDMQELYEAYVENGTTDNYEDWLDGMLDQSYEESQQPTT
jgi:hypothetical protein